MKFVHETSFGNHHFLKPSVVVVKSSDCNAAGCEFYSGLGMVHSTFHPFGLEKMNTKIAWELNTDNPTLG